MIMNVLIFLKNVLQQGIRNLTKYQHNKNPDHY